MRRWGDDFLLRRAARLKSGARLEVGPRPEKYVQLREAADTVALETLQQMGMAPPDAEIEAAAKPRAEMPDADKPKDDGAGAMKGHIRERTPGHWTIVIHVQHQSTGK